MLFKQHPKFHPSYKCQKEGHMLKKFYQIQVISNVDKIGWKSKHLPTLLGGLYYFLRLTTTSTCNEIKQQIRRHILLYGSQKKWNADMCSKNCFRISFILWNKLISNEMKIGCQIHYKTRGYILIWRSYLVHDYNINLSNCVRNIFWQFWSSFLAKKNVISWASYNTFLVSLEKYR